MQQPYPHDSLGEFAANYLMESLNCWPDVIEGKGELKVVRTIREELLARVRCRHLPAEFCTGVKAAAAKIGGYELK